MYTSVLAMTLVRDWERATDTSVAEVSASTPTIHHEQASSNGKRILYREPFILGPKAALKLNYTQATNSAFGPFCDTVIIKGARSPK